MSLHASHAPESSRHIFAISCLSLLQFIVFEGPLMQTGWLPIVAERLPGPAAVDS